MSFRQDVRGHWKLGVLVVAVYFMGGLLSCFTPPPAPDLGPDGLPRPGSNELLGGDGWRVYGVREETAPATLEAIERRAGELAECADLRVPGDLNRWRFFVANIIAFREFSSPGRWQWKLANGIALTGERWVYIRRPSLGYTPAEQATTLDHELLHVLAGGMNHPEIDPLVCRCAGQKQYCD